MTNENADATTAPLRIEKAVYGGDGLARTSAGQVRFLPFTVPGELVTDRGVSDQGTEALQILEPSIHRVAPRCVHFGVCGGCQYQMASYEEQLTMKAAILRESLARASETVLPELRVWGSPEPYGYRNRIRLRVRKADNGVQLGYSLRGSNDFLPVTMCPIAAPVLWHCAEALMQAAAADRDAAEWMHAAAEVEILCDADASKVQVHLLCPGPVPQRKGALERTAQRVVAAGVPLVSVGASRLHVASGRALEALAGWGPDGLAYRVGKHSFWLRRGSFFQVNRFLVPRMVEQVCGQRSGALAWDLFAGVGLFARTLAQRFAQVTAVEASPIAAEELRRGLRPGDAAVQETTLAFLRKAVLQRERPELIVLDPPRAGAGEEACTLLRRLAPREIVYVSCDPTTLARDLTVLAAEYDVAELHMVDLFPQTYHLETVMVLRRRAVAG